MDNVFIGTKSVILPNVRIGSNVIVAAGSIVTKDLESGGVYAGNPARKIGDTNKVMADRIAWTKAIKALNDDEKYYYIWKKFYEIRVRNDA